MHRRAGVRSATSSGSRKRQFGAKGYQQEFLLGGTSTKQRPRGPAIQMIGSRGAESGAWPYERTCCSMLLWTAAVSWRRAS